MMLEPFILRAILAGIAISIVIGTLGCFVIWRKMAYFGDSLAHSSLLGIALGMLSGINFNIAIIIVCTLFAVILVWLQQKKFLATDSLLGILAHASLSIGMVVISLLKAPEVDLHAYLFGDILSVGNTDLYWIYGGAIFVFTSLFFNWQKLNLITICQDLAASQGINIFHMQILLMFLMTIAVAISIHIFGILLITSMLIIPAASARKLARSPESMAALAAFLGSIAIICGIFASLIFAIPSGPAIVVSSVVLFILSFLFRFSF
ncbi:MAG TPA: iron chelate uptake ABC transporter family permease subunit [Rickettsiales bacterium]|nr:iron chelate uptake ABC transporter family permease subunit [Rickettsiales bacterium]